MPGVAAHSLEGCAGGAAVAEYLSVSDHVQVGYVPRLSVRGLKAWTGTYLRQVAIVAASSSLSPGEPSRVGRPRFGGTCRSVNNRPLALGLQILWEPWVAIVHWSVAY
jgi:hypothetical protein